MVTKELREAAVEFNCILGYLSKEITDKIPKKIIEFLQSIESPTYVFIYDSNKKLNEQNLKNETRGLIALVYRDYICNEDERQDYMIKCQKYKLEREEELRNKYNLNNIFRNKQNDKENKINSNTKKNEIIEIKEKGWIQKIFDKIKKGLKKNGRAKI